MGAGGSLIDAARAGVPAHRHGWRRAVFACGVSGACVVLAAAPVRAAPSELSVSRIDARRVSIRSVETPVAQVLAEFGRRFDIRVVLFGDFTEPYTGRIAAAPVADAIRRLTDHAALVLIHAPVGGSGNPGAVEEIRVYRAAAGAAPAVVSNPAPAPVMTPAPATPGDTLPPQAASAISAQGTIRERIESVSALEGAADADAITALGEILREDPDLEVRRRALDALRRIGVDETVRAIEQGLGDEDRNLRGAVVAALGEGETEHSVASLGQVVFGDPDGELRAIAVSLLAQHPSEAARAFLDAVIDDPDGAVRDAMHEAVGRR